MKNEQTQKGIKTIFISLLLLACIILSACTTGNVVSETKKEIRIGALLPLSGQMAYIGEYMQEGLDMAKEEINADGGVNGWPIEIIYEDTQGDVKSAVSGYQNLAKLKDVHTFLITLSGVTLGVAPLSEKDKNILFTVGTVSPKISDAGDYVFRHSIMPNDEITFIADFIYKKGYHNISIIYVNTEGGVSYRDLFEKSFKKLGGEIGIEEPHEYGATDYKTNILKLKAANPAAVLVLSYANEAGLILKQSKELNFKPQWFATNDVEGPKLITVGGDAVNGMVISHYFSPDLSSMAKRYEQVYEAGYGKKSDPYAALIYDGLKALAEAMKKCKDPDNDTACIKDSLYKLKDYVGVTGSIVFDNNGDTHKIPIMKIVKDGEFVKYK